MSWEEILKMTPEESSEKYRKITSDFMDTFTELDSKFSNMAAGRFKDESAMLNAIREISNLLKQLKPKLDDYIKEIDFQLEGR
tara:strand:+ start:63 stop:311 length:249 start_codon:yes stop_codon:yes gene_type:complete